MLAGGEKKEEKKRSRSQLVRTSKKEEVNTGQGINFPSYQPDTDFCHLHVKARPTPSAQRQHNCYWPLCSLYAIGMASVFSVCHWHSLCVLCHGHGLCVTLVWSVFSVTGMASVFSVCHWHGFCVLCMSLAWSLCSLLLACPLCSLCYWHGLCVLCHWHGPCVLHDSGMASMFSVCHWHGLCVLCYWHGLCILCMLLAWPLCSLYVSGNV